MLNLRRSVVGAALVLLVSGVASAQTPSPTDIAELRVKANAGNADAQYNLGVWYRFGQGVPQDSAQGAAWIRKSAEQGHIGAQFNLGLMYSLGQGVPTDYVEAHQWLNLAASRASVEEVTQYTGYRDGVAAMMTPQQVADAQQRATDWLAAFEQLN